MAWRVETARAHESNFALPLLDAARARGFAPETCAMDSGYDNGPIHDGCEARDCRPIVALRETPAVKRGEHKPPTCEHGEWIFAGSDTRRGASKWRCPVSTCSPASTWVKGIAFTRSCLGTRPVGGSYTEAAPPSSASSGA